MIEFEVKIPNIDVDEIRRRLLENGAVLHKPSCVHKNITFHLPEGREINGGWLRTRDEGDKITMSLKIIDGNNIFDQKEYCFIADNLEESMQFLKLLGAREKARQEKRRETWMLSDCEIVIDEWPFLEPLIEIEGPSEEAVMEMVGRLGYSSDDCRICAAGKLYAEKYGIGENIVNNHMPLIVFDMENPFLK